MIWYEIGENKKNVRLDERKLNYFSWLGETDIKWDKLIFTNSFLKNIFFTEDARWDDTTW